LIRDTGSLPLKPKVNIQSLLARIKTEGISEAQKESDAIRGRAQAQASEMLRRAEMEVLNTREGFEAALCLRWPA